ncbi:MAG: DUF4468 domain-containing protein [Mariniphaga sp.]|nr:DUF4468 domain-containing protein [Mariniphaga sp.]
MKTIVCFLILLPFFASAQQRSEVVELTGKSAEELYGSAKEYLVINTKPGNLFIQIDNPAEQKIISAGVKNIAFSLQKYPTYIDVNYAISLQFKDGNYEYSVYIKSIKYEDGFEINYDDFKSITTKVGWETYLKKTGLKPVFNKNVATEGNRKVYALLEGNIDGLISDLTNHLRNGKQIN